MTCSSASATRGRSHLYRVAVDGGAEPRLVLGGADRVVSGLSVAGPPGRSGGGDVDLVR